MNTRSRDTDSRAWQYHKPGELNVHQSYLIWPNKVLIKQDFDHNWVETKDI